MKKYFGLMSALLLCLLLAICASAADATVYLNDGGTGDGMSASAPLGDMTEAITAVADGGKVVITDTYTLHEVYEMPQHAGDVTIIGGTLIFAGDPANRFYASGAGKTTFEHLALQDGTGKGFCIAGRFNELIMGDGIDTTTAKIYVIGGYQKEFPEDMRVDLDSHVTVKSGKYHCVAGSSRGASTVLFEGTSHITVDGGEINILLGGSCNGSAMGGSDITVNGGTVSQLMMAGDKTRRINGDATLTVNGGIIGQLSVNNITGHATVNYNGGQIGTAAKSVESSVQEFVTDGTATLNVNPELNAALVALAFDEVNYVGGKTPAVTSAATEPETTTAAPAGSEDPTTTEDTAAVVTEETTITEETTAESVAEDTTAAHEKETETLKTTAEAGKTAETEKTGDTSAPAAAPKAEGGLSTGAVIGIAAAVIVVIAVVAFVIIKKKK